MLTVFAAQLNRLLNQFRLVGQARNVTPQYAVAWFQIVLMVAATVMPLLMSSSALAQNPATPAEPPTNPAERFATPNPFGVKANPGSQLVLSMKTFGTPDGFTLKTVKTERRFDFTRPKHWGVQPSSNIVVSFQHSPNLLPERSSLNVLVNNRILKSIQLGKDNINPTTLTIPIPPDLIKDNNQLAFQVDQHYTYQCEDPFSEELWSTILPDTKVVLNYQLKPIKTDLAAFPYPLIDALAYETATLNYAAPTSLSDESLSALGVIAANLGKALNWRPGVARLVAPGSVPGNGQNHTIVVGTPEENPAIGQLASYLPIKPNGNRFTDPNTNQPLKDSDGVIQFIPNPSNPSRSILVITGNTPKAVFSAARALSQNPLNKLFVGKAAIIKEYNPGPLAGYRDWDGFIQQSGNTLSQLGLNTWTARGITALPIYYKVNVMPDLYMQAEDIVKVKTVYSYSSQTDSKLSQLEVRLNGKSLKSVPLDNPNGANLQELTIDIPATEVFTYNDLEYQFHLFPDKYDLCRYVTDVHLWGTIHNTTSVELPAVIRTPLPDLGLLNDGGFPLTAYPDLSQVVFAMPANILETDLQTMLQIATRLGRLSTSKNGIKLEVAHANTLTGQQRNENHIIAIGSKDRNQLFGEVKGKLHLLLEGNVDSLNGNDQVIAKLQHTPEQGILEEVLSPWHDKRVVILAFGETDQALKRIGMLFEDDKAFNAIEPGNIIAVNSDSGESNSIIALNKGEARYLYEGDLEQDFSLPPWLWVIFTFFAIVGVLSLIRFFFFPRR